MKTTSNSCIKRKSKLFPDFKKQSVYLFYVIYLFQVHRYLAVIWTTAILFSIFPLIGWNHYLSEVSIVGNASTIRTPYFCRLFLDLFITFVFIFSCFGQNVKLTAVWPVCRNLSKLLPRVSLQKNV